MEMWLNETEAAERETKVNHRCRGIRAEKEEREISRRYKWRNEREALDIKELRMDAKMRRDCSCVSIDLSYKGSIYMCIILCLYIVTGKRCCRNH